MITISLDEYGDFENDNVKPMFIAGVLFDDNGVEGEVNRERRRIEKYYKSAIQDSGKTSDFSYPQSLHVNGNKATNSNIVRQVKERLTDSISEFFQKGTYKGKSLGEKRQGTYHLFALIKSVDGKVSLLNNSISKFEHDDFAANRYFHMASSVVNRLVFHNPIITDDAPKVCLDIATRASQNYSTADKEKLAQYKQVGYEKKEARTKGYHYFPITNSDIYRTIITEQISKGRNKVKIEELNAKAISYNDSTKMEFLYLADTICSILQYRMRNQTNPEDWPDDIFNIVEDMNGSNRNLVFCYDEIDNYFDRANNAIERYDYHEALSVICDAKMKSGKCVDFYKKNWFPVLEDKIRNEVTLKYFEKGVSDLFHLININNLDKDKLIYLVEQYEKMLPCVEAKMNNHKSSEYIGRLRFKLYEIGVSAYCHIGMPKKACDYFQKCKENALYAGIDDFLRLNNKLAVNFEDLFEWEKALELATNTLENQSLLSEMKSEILQRPKESVLLDEAKAYSQCARILSFMRKEDAESFYKKALEKFGEKNANYRITQSFLLHYYIDMGEKTKYENEAKDYFGGETSCDKQIKYVLENCAGEDSNIDMEYALYVCVRGLFVFAQEKINNTFWEYLKSIDKQVMERTGKEFIGRHPWELIYKYLGIIAEKRGEKGETEEFCKKRKKCIKEDENYNVVLAIDKYSDVEVANEKKDILARNRAIDDLIKYLCERLDNFNSNDFNSSPDSRYVEIQKYFTFMFR